MNVELKCFLTNSESKSTYCNISVSDKIFKQPFKVSLIHQVVSSYLTNSRKGSKSQKSRSEVAGSNRKPWRQKGTGRARAGSFKSPIWRSGGVTFAAKPKEYYKKINKKMYKGAIKSILSKLVFDNRLFVVDNLFLEKPKTGLLLDKLKKITDAKKILIISDSLEENLILASRNLYEIKVSDFLHINPVSLINVDVTILTKSVINKIEEILV